MFCINGDVKVAPESDGQMVDSNMLQHVRPWAGISPVLVDACTTMWDKKAHAMLNKNRVVFWLKLNPY